MGRVVGVETSCDDTGIALVRQDRVVVVNAVSSQFEVHAEYGGVVPMLAAREHEANLPTVLASALPEMHVACSRRAMRYSSLI